MVSVEAQVGGSTVCSCYPLADDLHTAVTCVTFKSSVLHPSPTRRDAAACALPLGGERTCGPMSLRWATSPISDMHIGH